jgi:hypothetical protein
VSEKKMQKTKVKEKQEKKLIYCGKKIQKTKKQKCKKQILKKKRNTLWITIVIHSALGVGE